MVNLWLRVWQPLERGPAASPLAGLERIVLENSGLGFI